MLKWIKINQFDSLSIFELKRCFSMNMFFNNVSEECKNEIWWIFEYESWILNFEL